MLAAENKAAKQFASRSRALNKFWLQQRGCDIKRADDSLSGRYGRRETRKTHFVY